MRHIKKIKPFNPRLIYPLSLLTIVVSGIFLTINYYLLEERHYAIRQIQQIYLWLFIVVGGFAVLGYFTYGKLPNAEILATIYIYLSNVAVSHFWIKRQCEVYSTKLGFK